MNNFEFMRQITIGQYLPIDSLLTRLDPRARIVIFFLVLTAATFTPHWSGLLIALAVVFLWIGLGRISLGYALRGLIAPLPFLMILAILQLFLVPPGSQPTILFSIGPVNIYSAGLLASAVLLLRFCVLLLGLSLASFCLSTSEMIHGIASLLSPIDRLGIHTRDFVMALQVTLRFLPFLAQTVERIAKAQESRGAEWGTKKGGLLQRTRQLFPLMVPLFLSSLRRAENLALAMDARGYSSPGKHTSLVVMRFRLVDGLAILVTALMAAAIILV